jgi:hypothetical protein
VADEVRDLRATLASRVEVCWDHLDDAVSELVALHEVSPEFLLAWVGILARTENAADAAPSRSR